jgi:hypothetical protein
MELGTYTNPNLQALRRTSGEIKFKPTGLVSYDEFGPIGVSKVSMNPTTDEVRFAINGASVLGIKENTGISPVIAFEGQLYNDTVERYLNMGTQDTNVAQSSGTAATATMTAELGKSFDIGARNVTLVSVTVSAAAKLRDTDFFFDELSGFIRFPHVAAGIAASASVVVTFDKPAISRTKFIGGTNLNFYGSAIYLEKDDKSRIVRAEWSFPSVCLAPKEPGDSDISKNAKWAMEMAISGQWTKLNRAA